MAKFTSKPPKAMPKVPAMPAMAVKPMGKMPQRGERTATHNAKGEAQHPDSHEAWMKLGSD